MQPKKEYEYNYISVLWQAAFAVGLAFALYPVFKWDALVGFGITLAGNTLFGLLLVATIALRNR